jgi:hypothetical protein
VLADKTNPSIFLNHILLNLLEVFDLQKAYQIPGCIRSEYNPREKFGDPREDCPVAFPSVGQ